MKNNYKKYVKPILNQLSSDACEELAYDKTASEYLAKMAHPLFGLSRKNKQELMSIYIYWSIVDMYARANFFNSANQSDMKNFRVAFPHGDKYKAKRAYAKVSDLTKDFEVKKRFQDMQTLVKYANLKKMNTKAK